jgi:predicted signal transduction protein with EAL and GGDEF domain
MTNEQLTKKRQVIFSVLLTCFLLALFIISSWLSLGFWVESIYLNTLFVLNLIEGSILLITFMWTLETEKITSEAEIATANQQLMTLANTDPLTNLLNRRNMMARIEEEKEKMDKGGRPFSLIMIDVDDFKQINDSLWGPQK